MGKKVKSEQVDKGEKNEKDEKMAQVYRQFSREKYNTYKRQYRKLRESEIVSKIIREWESLNEEAKKEYERKYRERSGNKFFKSGSSSLSKSKSKNSQSKSKEKRRSARGRALSKSGQAIQAFSEKKKEKKSSPQIQVYDKKRKSPKRDSSDFKRSSSKQGRPFDDSDDPSDLLAKMKGKKKNRDNKNARNEAYIQFYKYYYERLSAEHPRWNSTQVTSIIKLLWKKKVKQGKRRGVKKQEFHKIKKAISGWQYYRRKKESEGMIRLEIRKLWQSLPFESKRFYKIQGAGKGNIEKKVSGIKMRKLLNSGNSKRHHELIDGIYQRNYSWMENQIN